MEQASVEPIATVDVLAGLGFVHDPQGTPFASDGLTLDFGGGFKLNAIPCMDLSLRQVVLLSGVYQGGDRIVEIEYRLPPFVACRELGLALVAYCLDNKLGARFTPVRPIAWLAEGRAYRFLLPWEQRKAADEARILCCVDSDYFKLVRADFRQRSAVEELVGEVELSFDGSMLLFKHGDVVLPVRAWGRPWPSSYSVPAANMARSLAGRITRRDRDVEIRDGQAWIGRFLLGPASPT